MPQIFQTMVSAIKTFSNIAFLSQRFNLYFTRSEYIPLKCTEKLSHVVSLFQQLHPVIFEALNSNLATLWSKSSCGRTVKLTVEPSMSNLCSIVHKIWILRRNIQEWTETVHSVLVCVVLCYLGTFVLWWKTNIALYLKLSKLMLKGGNSWWAPQFCCLKRLFYLFVLILRCMPAF